MPAAPGMPCQGEDRKYFYYVYEFLGVTSMLDLCTIFFYIPGKKKDNSAGRVIPLYINLTCFIQRVKKNLILTTFELGKMWEIIMCHEF